MKLDKRGSAILSMEECRQHLERAAASSTTGRIAINGTRSPYVIPVNFSMVAGGIVIRLGPGWAAFHLNGVAVTFEVDTSTATEHSGWSVVVEGVTRIVTYDEVARLGDNLPTPLVALPGVRVFEIVPFKVTGRAVEPDLSGEHTRDPEVAGQPDDHSRNVYLNGQEAEELESLLQSSLSDLSSEIADTDNAGYRRVLFERRRVLEGIKQQVWARSAPGRTNSAADRWEQEETKC
jgi:hypothetical protein